MANNKNKRTHSRELAVESILSDGQVKPGKMQKGGGMVLYITVAAALLACVIMVLFDFTGNTPEIPEKDYSNIDISSYPASLQTLYKENFEAAEFVASYPEEKDKKQNVSLNEYRDSEGVPLFIQWDKRWGYLTYGGDFAGITADAPMCMSMVGYYLTKDERFSPDKVIALANEGNFYKSGAGTSIAFMTTGAEALGLKVGQLTPTKENVIACLQKGSPVICLMGAGQFAKTYRYIVLRGLSDGLILLNDPNSKLNSDKQWKFEDLAKEIKGMWVFAVA